MDRLSFYSGSADVVPGTGPQERVTKPYPQLQATQNWRRKLSNFAHGWFRWSLNQVGLPHAPGLVETFDKNAYWFPTIEHAFQAAKFAIFGIDPSFALFGCATLVGKYPLIGITGTDAQRQRKRYILNPAQLQYWDTVKDRVMYSIRMAKYTSADVEAVAARNVLLQTGSAELWHVRVRQSQIRDGGLEDIRRQLQAHPMLFGSTR